MKASLFKANMLASGCQAKHQGYICCTVILTAAKYKYMRKAACDKGNI